MTKEYVNLAHAIVLQAVKDYRSAIRKLELDEDNKIARGTMIECERFFRSGWFTELAGFEGDAVLEKLQKEGVYDS